MHKSGIIFSRDMFLLFLKSHVLTVEADAIMDLNIPDHYPFICILSTHCEDPHVSFVYEEDFPQ
jgi:hypothetical protein